MLNPHLVLFSVLIALMTSLMIRYGNDYNYFSLSHFLYRPENGMFMIQILSLSEQGLGKPYCTYLHRKRLCSKNILMDYLGPVILLHVLNR